MSVTPRGPRSPIPAGNLIGRKPGAGRGAAQLVSVGTLAHNAVAQGVTPPAGHASPLQPIATHTILANPTGSTAQPIATTLPNAAAGITWTYGSTSITVTLANDLAALEGLGSTGIAVRTAADTWAQRTVTGTTSRLSVSNGDGVSGNPTLDIDAAYVGQASITTTGTLGTGSINWSGNIVTSGTGSLASLSITGTGGLGYVDLPSQGSYPSAPVSGNTRIWGYLYGGINLEDHSGIRTTISIENVTNDSTFSFQDFGGGAAGIITSADIGTVTATMLAAVILKPYTVGTLPGGVVGQVAYVTDQLTTPAGKGLAPTGGGSVKCVVFYNGSAWVGI